MTDSRNPEPPRGRDQEWRRERIREWAVYVRTHPDEDWGSQVNDLVNAQIHAARRVGEDRPDVGGARSRSEGHSEE